MDLDEPAAVYLEGFRNGLTRGVALGQTDREQAISEARSSAYGAGLMFARSETQADEITHAMYLGGLLALLGVVIGVRIVQLMRRHDDEDQDHTAAVLEVTDAAIAELAADEEAQR